MSNDARKIASRITRPGFKPSGDLTAEPTTMAERIEQVWTLSETCLAWQGKHDLRLQRTRTRILRP